MDPESALARLKAGNERYRSGAYTRREFNFSDHVDGQTPFAMILGCADSRVPAELVFDQGLGDLFIVRVAGNIATPSQVGSIEFAATKFGSRLAVVLGHSHCGAVNATLSHIDTGEPPPTDNLASVIDDIAPHLTDVTRCKWHDETAREAAAVDANVRANVTALHERSPVLKDLVERGELKIVGARYDLEDGVVTFLDDA